MSVVLITGGSRGIGRAIAEEFAAGGYAVAFTYAANKPAADAVVASLCAGGSTVVAHQADVRDFERACDVIGQVQRALGPIDVLVNNAGIRRDAPFHSMAPDAWRDVLDANLTGTFNYCRALMGDMVRRGGAVVNVASVSGVTGLPGQVNYSASKAGIIGLTKALAKEVARFGVRVNAIAPGFIDTDMTASIPEETRKKLYAQVPMRKPGTAREVARLALYLAGEDAAYVTGQVWTIDGGMS